MRSLLFYQLGQQCRKKALCGTALLLPVLLLALEWMGRTGMPGEMGVGFFTSALPSGSVPAAWLTLSEVLSGGSGACLLGAALGAMTISHSPEKALPVLAAGYSPRVLRRSQLLSGLIWGGGGLLLLQLLELLCFRSEFFAVFSWSPGHGAAMLLLRFLLALGNLSLFLLLHLLLRRREAVLTIALALAALEWMGTGPDLAAWLPAGALSGIFLGTASPGRLVLALGEAAVLMGLGFFLPPGKLEN